MTNNYDIFISYRRVGGRQYARILQLMLIQRGYRVFLDYDELTDGIFSDKIKEAIKEAPVFMLVLSKGSMIRCANEDDWVRQEIMLAIQQQKHIVPINPDNEFDGFPDAVPEKIRNAVGSHQFSEIGFGQALGVTTDLMIKNRLEATLGKRTAQEQKDENFEAAQETLRRMDAHNKFMKRLVAGGVFLIALIVLVTCFLFWQHHKTKEQKEAEKVALEEMRVGLQEQYKNIGLQLNSDLTRTQIGTIDTLLQNMVFVDTEDGSGYWISQFEFTVGQWYGILDQPYDETQKWMPMTGVHYGEICMVFLDTLRNMTNLYFDLPSADEWEYAASGGSYHETTLYVGSNDPDSVAWFKDNSGGHAHPTDGQQGKNPNMLDLFDMSGNVSELCNSPLVSHASNRDNGNIPFTVCGGNYTSPASEVTVTSRAPFDTDAKDPTVGFRVIIRKNQ